MNVPELTRPGLVLGFAFWAWMVALGSLGIAIHGSSGAAEARFLVSHGASGPVGSSVSVLYDPAGKHGVWEAGAAAARAPDRWLLEWSIGTVFLGAAVGLTSWGLILRRRRRAAAVAAVQPGA